MVSSLDGRIAKSDNSISWFEASSNYEIGVDGLDPVEFLKSIDCYVMGSRTYQLAATLATRYGWAYGDTPTIVLSSKVLSRVRPHIQFYNGELELLVQQELKPRYNNVWVVGGAEVASAFINKRLADEIRVSILPVLLGEGLSFFNNIVGERLLELKGSVAYKNGMVELRYTLVNE